MTFCLKLSSAFKKNMSLPVMKMDNYWSIFISVDIIFIFYQVFLCFKKKIYIYISIIIV